MARTGSGGFAEKDTTAFCRIGWYRVEGRRSCVCCVAGWLICIVRLFLEHGIKRRREIISLLGGGMMWVVEISTLTMFLYRIHSPFMPPFCSSVLRASSFFMYVQWFYLSPLPHLLHEPSLRRLLLHQVVCLASSAISCTKSGRTVRRAHLLGMVINCLSLLHLNNSPSLRPTPQCTHTSDPFPIWQLQPTRISRLQLFESQGLITDVVTSYSILTLATSCDFFCITLLCIKRLMVSQLLFYWWTASSSLLFHLYCSDPRSISSSSSSVPR